MPRMRGGKDLAAATFVLDYPLAGYQHDEYHCLYFSQEAFSRPLLLVERCHSIFLCPDILEVLSNAWPAGEALLDVRPNGREHGKYRANPVMT